MTDQSKIPLPGDGERGKGSGIENDAGVAGAKSLIERAVSTFQLREFAPPPVPGALRVAMARTRRPAVAEASAAPAQTAGPLAPAAAPIQPQPPIEVAADAPPVMFGGARHPVNRDRLREQALIDPEGPVTELLEEFRIVKRQLLLNATEIRRGGGGAAAQRILVCSPHSGEGKTYSAINLALSFAAEKESDVLLVDADFGKPSILSTLDLPGGPGLMDALVDPAADVADFVLGTDVPGLWVLPAGNTTTADSEYLNSSRTPAVLDRLTQGAPRRMVIFDSPPVLAASPAAELARFVGQAVLVVRADGTTQGVVEDAVQLLSGCRNIELLLNAVSFSPSGRKFGSYYGYGK